MRRCACFLERRIKQQHDDGRQKLRDPQTPERQTDKQTDRQTDRQTDCRCRIGRKKGRSMVFGKCEEFKIGVAAKSSETQFVRADTESSPCNAREPEDVSVCPSLSKPAMAQPFELRALAKKERPSKKKTVSPPPADLYHIDIAVATLGFSYSVSKRKARCAVPLPAHLQKALSIPRQQIPILKNINLSVLPGQMLAIMGPSGSGKSSLLNCLAGRVNRRSISNHFSGHLLYNHSENYKIISKFSSYVMQRDQLHEFLTVDETLFIAASLKMPHSSRQLRRRRVNEVISELRLERCRNSFVGGTLKRGISGGEMKRLSIAVELLDNPSLLFLDEPTSGLDSGLAYEILSLLLDIAKGRSSSAHPKGGGRTVICTVHQPRSQVFYMFDQLLLLNKGQVVYQGSAEEASAYFSDIGFEFPEHFNPADFLLDILTASRNSSEVESTDESTEKMPDVEKGLDDAVGDDDDDDATGRTVPGEQTQGWNHTLEDNQIGGAASSCSSKKPSPSVQRREAGLSSTFHQRRAPTRRNSWYDRVVVSAERIERLPEIYRESKHYKDLVSKAQKTLHLSASQETMDEVVKAVNRVHEKAWYECLRQVGWLTYRPFLNSVRNPLVCMTQLIVHTITGLVLGGVFFQVNKTEQPPLTIGRNVSGLLFCMTSNFAFGAFDAVLCFPQDRVQFNRERANHMYTPSAYFIGKNIADFPFQQIPALIQMVILYWMTGLRRDAGAFFVFLLINSVTVFASASYMYMIGAASPNLMIGNLVAPLVLVILMLLSGFYLSDRAIPRWIAWLRYLSFLRYTYFALCANEFPAGGETIAGITNDEILTTADVSDSRIWFNVLLCAVLGICARIIAFSCVKYAHRSNGLES